MAGASSAGAVHSYASQTSATDASGRSRTAVHDTDKRRSDRSVKRRGLGEQSATTRLRPRNSPRMIALGLLLTCLGGLGAALLWQQFTHSQSVVVAARPVTRGQVITAADLATTSIGEAPGIAVVPAAQISSLIGKSALYDWPAGSLVGPGSIGTLAAPTADVQLGLRLTDGRAPVVALTPGTRVQIVPVPGSTTDSVPTGPPVDAIVVTSPQPTAAGDAVVLDVAVAPGSAVRVAQLAAKNQITVVRAGG